MKASEMTNEEIADNLEAIPAFIVKEARKYTDAKVILREAAARLRNVTVRTDNSGVIAELQRRLKVAEGALVKMQSVACAHCDLHGACNEGEDGMVVQCNDMIAINNALAAIRGEGGAK